MAAVAVHSRAILRFGPFEFDREAGELRRSGRLIRLPPQPSRVLEMLAIRTGHVVTREEIRREIWDEETFVDFELGLNYCLSRIRSALGDNARSPRYIETLPRRGYRFIVPVESRRPFLEPTLAVLPFENLNHDPEWDYFADGMADALTTELGKERGLRVLSRQSVLHLKGSRKSLAEIAGMLRADAVVEGSVFQAGSRVRITAQLVEVEPERHIWSESYECEMKDILVLQARVARAITERVQGALSASDASAARSVDPEAHVAYLKARFHSRRWTREGFEKALEHLRQAIRVDPSYPPPYCCLSDCLALLGYWGHASIQETYPRAKEAALKALELDPTLSAAHKALAFTLWLLDWDLEGCEREARRAIDLSPSDEAARLLQAMFLVTIRGDKRAAFAESDVALRLDPLSESTNFVAAWVYLFGRDYDRAAEAAVRTLELYPGSLQALYVLGLVGLARDRPADALAALERAASISRDSISLGYLGHAYARAGRRADALALLDELLEKRKHEYVAHKSVIAIYAGLGDPARALEEMERAFDDRDPVLFWWRVAPIFDPVASDRRFESLQRRLPGSRYAARVRSAAR